MKYKQVNLTGTIEGMNRIAESETDETRRNIFFSARDYLEMFRNDTENKAVAWETILECKKKKEAA
ncbi:MAG: hypothetical protein IJI14_06305 [Anaerolineaceae bacterium]|nr:hypothetical protein [Anaerolineaceae bacterium]